MLKKNYRRSVLLLAAAIFLIRAHPGLAQYYGEWCQIRTEHFTILFRKNLHEEAQRMANTLDALYEPVQNSIGVPPQHTLLVLENRLAISNGYAWPGRMAFYTLPAQDDCNTDWLSHLAVHEYRHTAQQAAFWGPLLIPYHIIPTQAWLFEGDAVVAETVFSKSGRGRLPSFSLLYRTNLLEERVHTYHQHALGSLQHLVPDYYKVGYFMMSFLRKTYGRDFFKKILSNDGSKTFFKTFGLKIKEVTGKSFEQIYSDTNGELIALWQKQLEGLNFTPVEVLAGAKDSIFDGYYFPQEDSSKGYATIVAYKEGMDSKGSFVAIDEKGDEAEILQTITGLPRYKGFSFRKNLLAWTETSPDLLWGARGVLYSVIKLFDLKTKRTATIDNGTRYVGAQLSPDATRVLAIESDEAYKHAIVVFSTKSLELVKRLTTEDNQLLKHAAWSEDGKMIVAVANKGGLCSVVVFDPEKETFQNLTPYSEEHISKPLLCDGYVLYNSSCSGVDNIYAMILKTGERYQVTCRPYGAYNAHLSDDKKWIYFNDFGRNGMEAVRVPFDPRAWKPLAQVEDRSVNYCEAIEEHESDVDILSKIPNKEYEIYEYPIFRHALSNWGLAPVASIMDLGEKKVGVVVSSSDLLNVLNLRSGVHFDIGKTAVAIPFQVTHYGWYPIVKFRSSFEIPLGKQNLEAPSADDKSQEWIKNLARHGALLSVTLPLTYASGIYYNTAKTTVSAGANYELASKNFWLINGYKLSLERESYPGERDIRARWGQTLVGGFTHTPPGFGGKDLGYFAYGYGKFLFPGFAKAHSFGLKILWQKNTNIRLDGSKQTKVLATGKFLKDFDLTKHSTSLCLGYAFPLMYLDMGSGDLVFFKRIYVNLLVEYLYFHNLKQLYHTHPITFGAEIMCNAKALMWPVTIGLRPKWTLRAGAGSSNWTDNFGVDFVLGSKFL